MFLIKIIMTKLLIIGAGRSSTSLINYLTEHAKENNWRITVADADVHLAESKTKNKENVSALEFDVNDSAARERIIIGHDFVISMLPAFMHGDIARDCVRLGKHLATASYVSDVMQELDEEAKQKGLLLLNECGLDPGLDHASAMKIIDDIHQKGGKIMSFKSYCGGLVAPESNDNPWGYKFSWNPRNVVLAGQGTAQYLENGKLTFIPYNRLFTRTETINIDGHGSFEAYANRDSLNYQKHYGLNDIKTLLRGTIRQTGYCKAWNVFVKLGLTDDSVKIKNTDQLTYSGLLEGFLPSENKPLKEKLIDFMGKEIDDEVLKMLDYLDLFVNKEIKLKEGSPAQLLQSLLEEKWKLKQGDKDMIVMQHVFEYTLKNKNHKITSSLVVKGDNDIDTAMSKTVGLPLAISVKNFLTEKIKLNGVQIPVVKSIYIPLLSELEHYGIAFNESDN